MLLPHESTVPHVMPSVTDMIPSALPPSVSVSTKKIEGGLEPGATHDMDDDEIDYVEDAETSSDQSNWQSEICSASKKLLIV